MNIIKVSKKARRIVSTMMAAFMIFALVNITPAKATGVDATEFYRQASQLITDNWSLDFAEILISLQIGNPTMLVGDQEVRIDAESADTVPVIVNGRTLLPIRALVEMIGGQVQWEGTEQIVTIDVFGETIELQINSETIYVNDEPISIDTAPVIINGRTMLPVRAIAENLGFMVSWDGDTQTVDLSRDFQTKRLIVKTNSNVNFNVFGAETVVAGPDNITVLQFATIRETYVAYDALNDMASVVYAEPDIFVQAVENIVNFSNPASGSHRSWGVERIGADRYASHLRTIGRNDEITVAVLDTGVSASHTFLSGRVRNDGWNFINGNSDSNDVHGHGTHVAGTIVDSTPGLNVKILPVKVLNDSGSGTYLGIANGICYATDKAKVINMSLGGSRSSCSMLDEKIENAISRGVTVVVAAGNNSSDSNNFCPAHNTNAVTVSAVDSSNRPASFTNYGSVVDIAAPGVDINSSIPNNGYQSMSGTSMAAPHVAAAAAMYLLHNPSMSPSAVERTIKSYYDNISGGTSGRSYGVGILNMTKALDDCCDGGNPEPDPDPIHDISITPSSNYTFPQATVGYPAQTAHNVTVSNRGNQASGAISIALSGTNASSFTLNKTSISNIAAGGSDTFSVTPNSGLAAGSYSATVTVSGSNIPTPMSFTVSFTVVAAQDDNENNTLPHRAITITLNNPVRVNIESRIQTRWYRFTAPTTGIYVFESSNNNISDPVIALLNVDNLLPIPWDNDSGDGTNFRLQTTLTEGQTIYITCAAPASPGSFTLTARMLDNTSFDGARPISLNSPVTINIEEAGQKRYYIFTAPSAGTYVFESSNNGNLDPHGWLYSAGRNLLVDEDDYSSSDYNRLNYRISYNLQANEQVYIVGGMAGSGTGSYTLTVTR